MLIEVHSSVFEALLAIVLVLLKVSSHIEPAFHHTGFSSMLESDCRANVVSTFDVFLHSR